MTDTTTPTGPFVFSAMAGVELAELDEALLRAFRAIREALIEGRAVIVFVSDSDLLGHGSPADAALAGGLLGLTRALATEGVREGWRINALAIADDIDPVELDAWTTRLAESTALNGGLLRLGNLHLGKVPV